MKNKMIKMSTRVMAAVLVAASVLSTATPVYAAENTTIVEGQGDVIDDQFAYVEGQGDVIDDEFAYVEGQGDVIDDEFAYVEGQGDVIDDQFAYVEGQGDVIDDQFAYVEGQGDVIDDQFAYVEGQGDVIDDQFAYVEDQGDVIDDQFAYVEGQGDVIDDQFAYVEGQGDIIDDQFAVASDECEYVTDEQFVVDSSCMKNVSFAAVGSAVFAEGHIFEPTENDEEIKKAYDATNVDEKDKSPFTKAMETFNKETNLFHKFEEKFCETIDKDNSIGVPEKELEKEIIKTGLGTANGLITGEIVNGAGAVRKGTKAIECFSKAFDSKTTEGAVLNTLEGVKNGLESVVSAFPGGGLVCSGVELAGSVLKYGAVKLVSWLW